MGTHRLRRTLARASVVSLCAVGVVPLSSGAANAAPVPPAARVFDTSMITGFGPTGTLSTLCTKYSPAAAGDAFPTPPALDQRLAFEAANGVKLQFDNTPLPPLNVVGELPILGAGGLLGPPLLFGLVGSLLELEIVDQVIKLDVTIPSSANDVIIAGDADNVILGGAGNDYICGGPGGDIIDAGSGADEIVGITGEDLILGGSGPDNGGLADPDDLLCYLGGGNNLGC